MKQTIRAQIVQSRSSALRFRILLGRCKLTLFPYIQPPSSKIGLAPANTDARPNDEARDSFLAKVDAAIKPFIGDMGYDWEYSVEETRRDLWKINGLVPPMPNTKAEKTWFEKNEPVPFEKADGGL